MLNIIQESGNVLNLKKRENQGINSSAINHIFNGDKCFLIIAPQPQGLAESKQLPHIFFSFHIKQLFSPSLIFPLRKFHLESFFNIPLALSLETSLFHLEGFSFSLHQVLK